LKHTDHVKTYVHGKSSWFQHKYGVYLQNHYNKCKPYHYNNQFKFYYSGWFKHGFCGGFYYPIRPWYAIHEWFYYPVIYWLYVDLGPQDIPFYQEIYLNEYPSCPVKAFEYARVFFPTDSLRDLGIEMSALKPAIQCNFRESMLRATKSLQQQLSELTQS